MSYSTVVREARSGVIDSHDNPSISPLLWWVTAVESVVLLVAGVGVLLVPSIAGPQWPWDLTPFNALLLGAIYSASLMATLFTVYVGRWAPARLVVPMIFFFTLVILVVSVLYLDRFDSGWNTWLWFVLYVGIPANALLHMWLYRSREPVSSSGLAAPWRAALLLPTMLLGLYGIGLLVAPETLTGFWPWPIDALHGRMYSVLYMTPALGALLLYQAAPKIELLTMGVTQGVLGIVPIFGLVVIDRRVDRIDWAAGGTWLWVASFAVLALTGLGLVLQARAQKT